MNPNYTWLDIDQLAEQLCCSNRIITDRIKDEIFCAGSAYYTLGNSVSKGAKRIFCLELCREALLRKTAELAKQKSKEVKGQETYNESHLRELVSRRCKA